MSTFMLVNRDRKKITVSREKTFFFFPFPPIEALIKDIKGGYLNFEPGFELGSEPGFQPGFELR